MRSFRPTAGHLNRRFVLVDMDGVVLGRACARIAHILRGKHKPIFTPGVDCGDHVVVINSAKLAVTGKKLDDKIFYKHTGYVGNMKSWSLRERMNKDPCEVIRTAVKRMLPRGPLGRSQLRMLHIYPGVEHDYNRTKTVQLDIRKV